MGYNSEVKLAMGGMERVKFLVFAENFKQALLTTPGWEPKATGDWPWGWTLHEETGFITFSAESTKWYESYDDIQVVYTWIEKFAELGGCYNFLRIGADADDVQHDIHDENAPVGCEPWVWVQLHRTASFDI